jgi:RNA polymerase sigma-70 factor (ECF subfamily)
MQPDKMTNGGQAMSDAHILRRIAAGERNAFELLLRRYNRPLFRTARSILKDDAEAEDALQDAYLLVFRKLDTFRAESSLLTWLTRIVVNQAIAHARKSARRANIIALDGAGEWDDQSAEAGMRQSTTEQPEQAALRTETRRVVEQKIDHLPDAFRTVFVLRAVQEMTVEETAACLDIPEATVRTRYFRARGMLREALAREIDFAIEDVFSFDGARCDRIVATVMARLGEAPGAGQ